MADASIVFCDFNTNLGLFGYDPNFSSTSVGDDAASTSLRVLTGTLEGSGADQVHIEYDNSGTATRIRHLSGGPPYNSANAGTPVGNTGFSFTTSPAEDGFIGFYAKSTSPGWQVSINLDGTGGTIAEMDGSTSLSLISDGDWHLYEWNLDSISVWGVVPGIGGGHGGSIQDGPHTIDSIYFRDLDGAGGANVPADIFLDFVAKTDSGTVANLLIPEPSTCWLFGFGGLCLARRRRGAPVTAKTTAVFPEPPPLATPHCHNKASILLAEIPVTRLDG
jgi:hypothetical protein